MFFIGRACSFPGNPHKVIFKIEFWAIRPAQKVENDRTVIFGLQISRNTAYGVNSYLYIMIFVPFKH